MHEEMREESSLRQEHYEQLGVAMTCRSYAEYARMFDLSPERLFRGPVLDVAAGASSFAAEAERLGVEVTAADPLYSMAPVLIREKGLAEIETSTGKLAALKHRFDWSYYGSIDEHRAGRERSLERFYEHFSRTPDRYAPAYLPHLPFADGEFSLVLCSHFLFLYQEQFDAAFHDAALLELMRVCRQDGEARVYPLLSLRWERYPQLEELMQALERRGIECRLERSHLPFIPGSSEMLVMRHLPRESEQE